MPDNQALEVVEGPEVEVLGATASVLESEDMASGSTRLFREYISSSQAIELVAAGVIRDSGGTVSGLQSKVVEDDGTQLHATSSNRETGDPILTISGDRRVEFQLDNATGTQQNGVSSGWSYRIIEDHADVWWSRGQGVENHGLCKDTLPVLEPSVQWTTDLPTSGNEDASSNIVTDGTYVYGQTWDGVYFRLDKSDGSVDASYDPNDTNFEEPRFASFVSRKHDLFVSHYTWDDQHVSAFHTDGSGLAWRWNTPTSPSDANNNQLYPYYMDGSDDEILVHCGDAGSGAGDTLYCLNTSDGTVKWKHVPEEDITANGNPGIAPDEDNGYWGNSEIFENALSDGSQLTRYNFDDPKNGHFVINHPYIYVDIGVSGGSLTKVNIDTGSEMWQKSWDSLEESGLPGGPSLNEETGHIFLGGGDGEIAAFDNSGSQLWTNDIGIGNIDNPPAIGNDENVIVYAGDDVKGVDPDNGNALWTWGDDSDESFQSSWSIGYGDGGIYLAGPNTAQLSFIK